MPCAAVRDKEGWRELSQLRLRPEENKTILESQACVFLVVAFMNVHVLKPWLMFLFNIGLKLLALAEIQSFSRFSYKLCNSKV